jgi:hypothetical protein
MDEEGPPVALLDDFYTPEQLAEELGMSARTLQRMRARGEGPPYVRPTDHRILYPREGVPDWLASRMGPRKRKRAA